MAGFNDKIPGDTGLTSNGYVPPNTPNHPGGQNPDNSVTGPLGDALKGFGAIGSGLSLSAAVLSVIGRRDFWIRVGIGIGGASLIYVGIWILIVSNREIRETVTGVASTAVKATPEGAAAEALTGAVS